MVAIPSSDMCLKIAKQMRPRLTNLRHEFAQHPEVAPGLHHTRAKITKQFKKTPWTPITLTHSESLCYELHTGKPGPQLLFCANAYGTALMDQDTQKQHSHILGFTHRIHNHDAEITTLIGLGRILSRFEEHLCGTIRLLFIADDILNLGAYHELNQKVFNTMRYATNFEFSNRYYDQRIYYQYEFSKPRIDELDISFRDHTSTQTILMAAKLITQLPNLLRQTLGDLTPLSLKFNKIHASEARSIHPNTIDISGRLYSYDKDLTYAAVDIITDLVQRQMLGQEALIQTRPYLPTLYNDTHWLNQLLPILEQLVSAEHLIETPIPCLENNYFAVISETMACVQLTLGTRKVGEESSASPVFQDSCMSVALAAALGIIFRYINKDHNVVSGQFDGGNKKS